ncbi:hypothetical protein FACS189426_05870 [Bacteroidia bacterium]|nr:hypothetical protein FACS189426_05870 [Bacteroidia bacterium]GHV71784.1 hypothetical protein FACS189420_7950 [Bacteroidia bacterium]
MEATVQKLNLIHWITELQDDAMLDTLADIKNQTLPTDWWNIVSADEKSSIEKGLQDMKENRIVSHSDVKKRYEKWII